MDRSNEVSSGSTDPNRDGAESKCCTICRTTKTPLWRGGPSGPKSLCNACGIRYRKERRDFLGLNDDAEKIKKETKKKKLRNGGKMDMLGLLGFDAGVLLKQRSMLRLKRQRHLGEEEEAAVLLMALSSGFL